MARFLQKYDQLLKSIPIPAVRVLQNENCQDCDYTYFSKDCYHTFVVMHSESVLYSSMAAGKYLVDCDYTPFCELGYACLDSSQCYHSTYLQDCSSCKNCHFCDQCISCQDCFGCVGLTHKQYCFFNRQLTLEAYQKEVAMIRKQPVWSILDRLSQLKQTVPQPASRQLNTENCPYGDTILNCKNVYWAFNSYFCDDSGYVYSAGTVQNCWDVTFGGAGKGMDTSSRDCQLVYEMCGGSNLFHCAYVTYCRESSDCYYCTDLTNCKNCFGCVGLNNKEYCILNNQLTKGEYDKAVRQIRKELDWVITG